MKATMLIGAALAAAMVWADPPATATWIGGGDRAVLTDPANWECKDGGGTVIPDAIPDAGTTVVSVSGNTSFNCPLGATPIWKTLSIGSVTLTADCDWRGAGSSDLIAAGSTLTLAGHNLQVKSRNGQMNRRINVTDASATGSGGEFHLYVAEGESFGNTGGWNSDNTFWFSGSVKFVKDGKGSYCPYYANGGTGYRYYNHTGGNVFHEGYTYLSNDGEGTKNETYYAQNSRPVFGANGCFIQVDAGGELDYKGIYDIGNHYTPFILNGGKLSNSRAPARPDYGGIREVQLLADSSMSFTRSAHVEGSWWLGGHTLTVDINTAADQSFYWRPGMIDNGTVVVTGTGWLRSYTSTITATNNVTLDIAAPLAMEQVINADTYIARYAGESNSGTAAFNIFGRFQPVTQNFYPVTMQNGSTIDLSDQTGVWNSTGAFGAVKYAANATITLDIGDRVPAQGDQLVAWTERPSGIAFRVVGTNFRNESPLVNATGVYVDLGDAVTVKVAHWTDATGNHDLNDAANWASTNGAGMAISGVPGTEATVYFERISFAVADSAAFKARYQAVYVASPVAVEADSDWSGFSVDDPLLLNARFELNGHRFVLSAPDGVSTQTITVNDSLVDGGTFAVNVPIDSTFVNSHVKPTGTAKFEKIGPGRWTQKCDLSYTGGTFVNGGILRANNEEAGDGSVWAFGKGGTHWYFGPVSSSITIGPNGTFDVNGCYDGAGYQWVFNGGTLINTKLQANYNWGAFGRYTLTADSTFDLDSKTVFYSGGNHSNLGGHTLTLDVANGCNAYMNTVTITNGTLVVIGEGCLDMPNAFNSKDLTLDLSSASVMNGAVSVSNLIFRYTGTYTGGANSFIVNGAFTPAVDQFRTTKLMNQATLDLSLQGPRWSPVSSIGSLQYDAVCSNLTVDVGARTPAAGEMLIEWASIPPGITWTIKGENVQPGDTLTALDQGLFYNLPDTFVTEADWTGAGEANNLNDPDNWTCRNKNGEVVPGVPGPTAKVHISGSFGNLAATGLLDRPWAQCTLGSITLTDDCDIRAYGAYTDLFDISSTIDLRGHKLYVTGPSGTSTKTLTVTDTTTDTDHPGEFHVSVPSGITFVNAGTTIAGNTKFVKEGPGTFSSKKFQLGYTGGNLVDEGGLQIYNDAAVDNATYAFGQAYNPNPLGAYNKNVQVNNGAWVDMNGVYDTYCYYWKLNGGTIKNTKNITKSDWGGFGNVTLMTNSTVNVGNTFFINGAVDLAGHELDVTVGSGVHFYVRGNIHDGTLNLVSGGYLHTLVAVDMRTVDLNVRGAALSIGGLLSVRDYYAGYNYDYNEGNGGMNVYGTFTPVNPYFYGCTMQDGSTIDLSGKDAAWSTQSLSTREGSKVVTFAANSTITVDIHDREFDFTDAEEVKVIDWTDHAPADTVRFVPDHATKMRARAFAKRADGLYAFRTGLVIIVR